MDSQRKLEGENQQRPTQRRIEPLMAAGGLLVLVSATALITYFALLAPSWVTAKAGPPEEFRAAATRQAASGLTATATVSADPRLSPTATLPGGASLSEESLALTVTANGRVVSDSEGALPTPAATENPYGLWPLPDWVEERYWLSIPVIGLEAPIIALVPREHEIEGQPVFRLPVPNSYAVSWDQTSAEPGFAGNTVLTGHSNLYGGVFSQLDQLGYGNEIAVWSEYGVYSYFVSAVEYLEENNQSLDIRYKNAQWLNDSIDDRITLITCWPNSDSSHRLIVVATR